MRTLDEAMGLTPAEIAQLRAKVEGTGVTQTILAGRADGVPGNCLQAALATVLRLPLDAVPHFLLFLHWDSVMTYWLAEHGWHVDFDRDDLTLSTERGVALGRSPRDVSHVVVTEHGCVSWDPHPSRGGLTTITEVWRFQRVRPAGEVAPA